MVRKMKIGIITILKVNNYGAELQAFALQKKIEDLGYHSEIIDYLFYKHKDFRYTKQAMPFVDIGLKRRAKEFIHPISSRLKSLPYRKKKRIRELKFEKFHSKYSRLSVQTYRSIDELYRAELDYDVFIVGSDQVWNPYSNISLKPYFLTFVPPSKRKASYASSFGVSSIPSDGKDAYREGLNNLDHISVREEQGVKIVREIANREASQVLDPTLLMDEHKWREFALSPSIDKPYLLLYVLTTSPYITRLAKKIAVDLNLNLVRICKNAAIEDKDGSIINIIDAGPSEFVGTFLDASFVLTNSFHGTAYAINFAKPFYTILPKHKPNNSRQQNLLVAFNMKDRIIKEGDSYPAKEVYFPDFAKTTFLLKEKRAASIQFLKNAISGGNNG
jgi:hypothetical protein